MGSAAPNHSASRCRLSVRRRSSERCCFLSASRPGISSRKRSERELATRKPFLMEPFHGTTILSVRRGASVALGGDGQVTLGAVVIKATARKVRRLYGDRVLAGFAGATADAFTLFERFEAKLDKHQGQLQRAAVELAKDWRSDRILRRLEAMLAVADATSSLVITGTGDVLEPEYGIVAIGSGGAYAQAAARALLQHTDLSAAEIVKEALTIAADICVYTNHQQVIEVLGG